MVFINNQNNKVKTPSIVDNNIAKPAKGELAFKVDETISSQILQFTNRKFYISNSPRASVSPRSGANEKISRITSAARKFSERSVSLNDTITELRAQTASLNVEGARISSSSSSVLYWGNWINEDETPPQRNVPSTTQRTFESPLVASVSPELLTGQSSWQLFGSPQDTIQLVSAANTSPISNQTSSTSLSTSELKNAIASDVQGKKSLGWSTTDILSYFLDPSSIGYKLYGGITKDIFKQAVTGIFSNTEIYQLDGYGNTYSGQTNGGFAASGGSTSNQTGNDSGSANGTSGTSGGSANLPTFLTF